jgi:hypothetical protein
MEITKINKIVCKMIIDNQDYAKFGDMKISITKAIPVKIEYGFGTGK